MPEMPKNAEFCCNICNFKCCKKSNWQLHIKTLKHIHGANGNNLEMPEMPKMPIFFCDCGKKYFSNSGLWKHKKHCNNNIETTDKQLIMTIIKDNNKLQNMMMEVIKNGTHNTNSNNNSNNNNKSFNLQLFLNETCKNAMNITDFVDSIKLQLYDLERVGEHGFVDGISNIIIKNLKNLDITERPIHCTDKKREVMYIKDENKWEKEDGNKKKMHNFVKKIANKSSKMIYKFKEAHPDCVKYNSAYSNQYNTIIIESMGGPGDNDFEKEEKIIKNIAKIITIDK